MHDSSVETRPLERLRPLSPRASIYRWRAPMLASFAHRVSGVILLLFIPLYLYLLQGLTGSPDTYTTTLAWLHSSIGMLALWLVGVALIYHLCSGIRFLCIDVGWWESRDAMRFSARLVLMIAALAGLLLALLLLWGLL